MNRYTVEAVIDFDAENEIHAVEQFLNAIGVDVDSGEWVGLVEKVYQTGFVLIHEHQTHLPREDRSVTTGPTEPIILANGATVIAYTERHPGGSGFRRHGIALCEYQHGIGDYVTWVVYQDDGGKWWAESGEYHADIIAATDNYRERLGIQKSTSSDLTS